VTSVSVAPPSVTLDQGTSAHLAAEARNASGSVLAGHPVTWTSSAPEVATVAGDGTITGVAPGSTTIQARSGGVSGWASVVVRASYDLDRFGVPQIITSDYLDLATIARISRFRSGIGHDYGDAVERCRSMKHYFQPRSNVEWSALVVRAPLTGTITEVRNETTFGQQVRITAGSVPAATVLLFHVRLDPGMVVGTAVPSGQRLGTHIGSQTMSDVAIMLATPSGARLVSYLDAMPDSVFGRYQALGVSTRQALIISRPERDAAPLACSGEQFMGVGELPNWVTLP